MRQPPIVDFAPMPQPTRRAFLAAGVAAAGLALGAKALAASTRLVHEPESKPKTPPPAAPGKLKILILGGTGFLGPALLDAAQARGHTVTLFNRGKTEKKKPGQFQEVEKLYGNRDPNLRADDADETSPKGLSSLEGRSWDAAIDTSGYVPRIVKASAEGLKDRVKHYTFISTISVYAANDKAGEGEEAMIGTLADETVESMGAHSENYGPLKALCEQAAEKAMPGRVLNVRPGFIVGPNDPTDRFTYWPVRASKPEGYDKQMLTPGDGTEPLQIIDVRDLAEWIVRCIERNVTGVFNATGPAKQMAFRTLIDACLKASPGSVEPVWVPGAFLALGGVAIGMDVPLWLPPEGETAGFHTRNCAKAIAAGLTFRPIEETVRATMEWWPKELERRITVTKQLMDEATKAGKEPPKMADPKKLRVGLTPEKEQKVLAAWASREKEPVKPGGDK